MNGVTSFLRSQRKEEARSLAASKSTTSGPRPTRQTAAASRPVGALVFGGAHGSLAVVRSLGRHGIPVWVLIHGHPIARFSRYASRHISWSGPDRAGAAEELIAIAQRHGLEGWVLFPAGDAEAQLVSQDYEALSSIFRLTSPPWEIARWAYDKHLTYDRAAEIGIDYPWSYYPRDRQDVAQVQCRFPVILKPTIRDRVDAPLLAKAWRADDRATLLARYDQAAGLVGEHAIVLQELIPGDGSTQYSYAAIWDRGAPVASLVARRARQFPIDFGYTSTFVETVEQPEVEDAACRFLKSIGYNGLVEVEFKYDARDARYKILDVNARAWTWIALGEIAGVDFPYLLWRLAMGETLPRMRGRAGVAWMHASRDAVAAVEEMALGILSPVSYVKSLRRPLRFAAFAADDPLPGIVDLPLALSRVLARRLPTMARRVFKRPR